MSDNLRRYLAIRDALRQWYPGSLNGHQARHLITLAMLISGIVGSRHTHLDKVATQVPSPRIAQRAVAAPAPAVW